MLDLASFAIVKVGVGLKSTQNLWFFSSNFDFFHQKFDTSSSFPVVHFKVPYITSDLGPFLSPYITFESNIRDLWSLYITFESNIQVLWSPYITLKIYSGSKLEPACDFIMYHWVTTLVRIFQHISKCICT